MQLDKRTELRRTLEYFAWFVGGAAGIRLLGIVITLPLLVFLYMLGGGTREIRAHARHDWGAYGLIWGLLEGTLAMR